MWERTARARTEFNPWTFLGIALLVPPVFCWFAIILGIAGLERAWELLSRLSNAEQLVLMLYSPLVAAVLALWSIRRLRRNDAANTALCRFTIFAGTLFALVAVLASLRSS